MYRRLCVWILCVVVSTVSCTSMKQVRLEDPPAPPFGRVKAGDTVTVFTKDGRTNRFVVAEVVGREIVSKNGGRYDRDEVVKLERKSFNVTRSVLLGLGIYAGVSLVVILYYVGSFSGKFERDRSTQADFVPSFSPDACSTAELV